MASPDSQRAIRERLVFQMELLKSLVDPERDPFAYLIFENRLSKEQYNDILNTMNTFNERIAKGIRISKAKFESEIYSIVPSRSGDFHFAEDIVGSLKDSGKYKAVHEELKKQGMNL